MCIYLNLMILIKIIRGFISDQRLEQMISQIDKLEDVVKVQRNQSDPTMFNKIAVFFQ
ncbi:acetolactate synthase 1 regulatory subunit [Escherichia coli]|nr:acetolactate synthase 1 regulatory subunit [Escherichia coli]